jgi:hypothetical protein
MDGGSAVALLGIALAWYIEGVRVCSAHARRKFCFSRVEKSSRPVGEFRKGKGDMNKGMENMGKFMTGFVGKLSRMIVPARRRCSR